MSDLKICCECREEYYGIPGMKTYDGKRVALCPRHASVDALAERVADLEGLLKRMLDDFDSLERSYPGLYATGAGWTLQPRVLEVRAALASPQSSPLPSGGDARDQAGVDLRPSAGEEGRG